MYIWINSWNQTKIYINILLEINVICIITIIFEINWMTDLVDAYKSI